MKTTNPLFRLFAKSPFGPMQEHMRVVEACVQELVPLLGALADDDLDTVRAHKATVFELERKADDLKQSIRSALPSALLMPVARRDLLDLLASQDAVADAAQDAAGLLAMGRLRVFPALDEPLREYCDQVVATVGQARVLTDRLDELLEVGFRGREVDQLLEGIDAVSAAESVTDEQGVALVQILFEHEDEMGPLSVVFWYELVRTLGHVADEAENVGDRLRLLVAG
jgi:predicted phosphate transport protein (TIGR00153 family)